MRLAKGSTDPEDKPEGAILKDLLCGIGPAHIHKLCANPFMGGLGFTPNQVADFTLDQIFMLLADEKNLRSGLKRSVNVEAGEAAIYADDEGFIKGRDKDGNEIKARVFGKSLVQRIRDGGVNIGAGEQEAERTGETRRQKLKRKRERMRKQNEEEQT